MAYVFKNKVGTASAASGNGGTSAAIDMTGSDLLVVFVASYGNNAAPALSDSQSNSYSQLTTYIFPTGARLETYYKAAPSVAASMTFTVSGASSFPAWWAYGFSGSSATPADQQNGNDSDSNTTLSTGSITPSQNNCLVMTAISFGASNSPSVTGGFSTPDHVDFVNTQNYGADAAYLIQTTAAASNPAWTIGTLADIAITVVSFLPSVGGDTLFGQALL